MKTNLKLLRETVRTLLSEVPLSSHMRKPRFGLQGGGPSPARQFDPQVHSLDDVMLAVRDEFAGVAQDLGVDDASDPSFIGYIGDQLSDKGVPEDLIRQVKRKLAAHTWK